MMTTMESRIQTIPATKVLGWISTAITDYDGDGCKDDDAEEDDDDNDGIPDVDDDCPGGLVGWTSSALTDHDSDGCQDSSSEDDDDDNDDVINSLDDCKTGVLLCEDPDDDNDGVLDGPGDGSSTGPDNCTRGSLGWTSVSTGSSITDYDGMVAKMPIILKTTMMITMEFWMSQMPL